MSMDDLRERIAALEVAQRLINSRLDALITRMRHKHDWETDKSGLIDRCRICGEERA